MPENLGGRYSHLPLPQREVSLERKKRQPNFQRPPGRGTRTEFAHKLKTRLVEIENAATAQQQSAPTGIRPHLVFRVPHAKGVPISILVEKFEDVGLSVVSFEKDKAVVAFRSDTDLTDFHTALSSYERGPRSGLNPKTSKPYQSTKWDVFEYIESDEMSPWERKHRIGLRLKESIGEAGVRIDPDQLYKVDVELWHPGSRPKATSALNEIRTFLSSTNNDRNRLLDHFVGDSIILARVAITGTSLGHLLDSAIVAEIELPPVAEFDPASASRETRTDFPTVEAPPENGPRVCILDSGVSSAHPLLEQHVGHEEAILTTTADAGDQNGHGTRVAGIAVFGSIRGCYEAGNFSSPVTLYSARVLNEHNQFDDDKLIVNQMRHAITTFKKPPYNCRIFNLSLGSSGSALSISSKQPQWAESLDLLARELKVLLVVSAGNNTAAKTLGSEASEEVLTKYKAILTHESAQLCDPATAAIAVTVGSIVEHDIAGVRHDTGADDILIPIARKNQPSPFTRSGAGVNGGIKPDFVDYGGNLVFKGTGNTRMVDREPGTSVMSFAMDFRQSLFSYDFGTSYAAPKVARKACLLWKHLEAQQVSPSPNLVRTLLGSAASVPEEANELFRDEPHQIVRLYGNGLINEDLAFNSTNRHVTLIADTSIGLDKFLIFEIPIPAELRDAQGQKEISICLAFDPPVRARRLDYLGVEMNFDLIRGKSIDEVIDAYKRVEPGEEPSSIGGANKVSFLPTMQPRGGFYNRKKATLQKGTWRFQRERDYGDSYWLVVRCERRWAPAEITTQDFAIAVTVKAEESELYNLISQRVRVRARRRG